LSTSPTTKLGTAATPQLEARVRLSHVNEPNRDEDTHNYADGKNSEHELYSPAPINGVASHVGSGAIPLPSAEAACGSFPSDE